MAGARPAAPTGKKTATHPEGTFAYFSFWEWWFENEQRAEFEGKVDALIDSPTTCKIYSYD